MLKKILLILFTISLIIPCGYTLIYVLNRGVIGAPQKMVSEYEATEYSLVSESKELKLTVCDDTTLVGCLKDGSEIINIRVEYENYGTAYEYHTAKIYNADTNECIDYVKIECDGKEIYLTSKTKNLDSYDPPDILDDIKIECGIFSRLQTDRIILKAIS